MTARALGRKGKRRGRRVRVVRRRWRGIGWLVAATAVIGLVFVFSGNDRASEAARLAAAAQARYQAVLARAAAGNADAEFAVAEALRRGDGVARNLDQAVRWYRRAAAQAHAGAEYALGTLYEKGEGVPRDYVQAAAWYRLAAELGHLPGAAFALAQLYYDGRGLPSNPAEALEWYRMAAEGGDPAAQYVLGTIYERGWNVAPDRIAAYKWFTLAMRRRRQAMAVDRGFDPATARAGLAAKMTDFEIMRGRQAAARWRPPPPPTALVRDGLPLLRPLDGTPAVAAAAPGSAVRLFSFALPARPPAKPATVSLLIGYAGEADRAATCSMAPRVRDAVTRALWSHPPADAAGPAPLGTIAAELAAPVNRVLGSMAVRRVFLYPGDRPLDANGALQTPFAAVDECPPSSSPPPNS